MLLLLMLRSSLFAPSTNRAPQPVGSTNRSRTQTNNSRCHYHDRPAANATDRRSLRRIRTDPHRPTRARGSQVVWSRAWVARGYFGVCGVGGRGSRCCFVASFVLHLSIHRSIHRSHTPEPTRPQTPSLSLRTNSCLRDTEIEISLSLFLSRLVAWLGIVARA